MIAPPERDLWMLDLGDGTVIETYVGATGTPVLPAMLDLYRLRWDLWEIADDIARFHEPHGDDADTADAGRTSDSSWIRTAGPWPADAQVRSRISAAARSPERTAPSIAPCDVVAVSVPAQCTRPNGSRSSGP